MPAVASTALATTSSSIGSMVSVAPKCSAASRRLATGSDTMICEAPASRAPCTTEMPMPPRPATSTVAPGSTCAVFTTAPTPVWTAQPMTQAISSGVSGSSHTTPRSLTTVNSLNAPTPTPRFTIRPDRENGEVPSGLVPPMNARASSQAVGSPRAHQ